MKRQSPSSSTNKMFFAINAQSITACSNRAISLEPSRPPRPRMTNQPWANGVTALVFASKDPFIVGVKHHVEQFSCGRAWTTAERFIPGRQIFSDSKGQALNALRKLSGGFRKIFERFASARPYI